MRAFPLWSVSNLSARSALPLVPGLFDLVIIDEASQCDIPSIVPLLARSKRAVLAGDPTNSNTSARWTRWLCGRGIGTRPDRGMVLG